ncbi:radical SAM protein [uncultured Desulfovibrio sp.]|uniref:radical SAM protein n=1 Tax=uncultured Desulfovibrio sp. TaxID=167968 RepID=UPI00262F1379|nr:radical SAM protein [uncultured Desulfovibrio sp.]
MNVKQTLKQMLPAPVKAWLRPYKMKLDQLRMPANLEGRTHTGSNHELLRKMRAFSQKYEDRYLHAMLERGWINPGHMFDEIGEIFSANNKLFLVGTQRDVERLSQRLKFIGVEIESLTLPDPRKVDLDYIASRTACGYTVIIGYEDTQLASMVGDEICKKGAHFTNVNIFGENSFLGGIISGQEIYCGIFSAYASDKVYLTHNNILITTICNLNCKYCLNYTPYDKHPEHFPIEELKKSVDIYFNNIDMVGLFQVSGGEPMLSPHLKELLEYISDKFREKIGTLCFVTNGTIVPEDEFVHFCKEQNIFIFLDNYTETLPRIKKTFDETRQKFDLEGIKYNIPKLTSFVKTFPPLKNNLNLSEADLRKKYQQCHIGVQNLRNGQLCSCTYHAFAENAGLIPVAEDNWFDMAQMTASILDKRKLVEFRFGFNKKGYVDWCRYCNGHFTINTINGPVGEQARGRLDWDINAPTFLDLRGD